MSIKVEEYSNYREDIHCPFCKKKIVDMDDYGVNPCPHTIFVAHDEGFEFIHNAARDNLGIPRDIDIYEIDWEDYAEDHGYDGLTSKITIPDSIKMAVYVPAPSGMGAYYGFSKEIE